MLDGARECLVLPDNTRKKPLITNGYMQILPLIASQRQPRLHKRGWRKNDYASGQTGPGSVWPLSFLSFLSFIRLNHPVKNAEFKNGQQTLNYPSYRQRVEQYLSQRISNNIYYSRWYISIVGTLCATEFLTSKIGGPRQKHWAVYRWFPNEKLVAKDR